MKYRDWKISEYSADAARLLEEDGYSPLVASVLASRGLDASSAHSLLDNSEETLFDAMTLTDMLSAVGRIKAAIENREHIAVFGDYDVDGITSSCLLARYLRSKGLKCDVYIPHRLEEGYGLSFSAISSLHSGGVSLIITVDCGITAVCEAEYARTLGIDMIITDHHECQEVLPFAAAVVNPKRPDCRYPNKQLAGVGVAFKLVCAVEGKERVCELLTEYGDLVALGTIADVMPVTGENRTLIKAGLCRMGLGKFPGLRSLIYEAGFGDKKITCTNVGFSIAPRINAAGRMGCANLAAELLLTPNEAEAGRFAQELCELNRERQLLESQTFVDVLDRLNAGFKNDSPIVLASDGWHQGIAGIVASKLSERFCLPVVMVCLDGDLGRGSCRSFGGFPIYSALEKASDLLEDFGGHELAAGFVIHRDNIEALRDRLAEYYRAHAENMVSVLPVDVEIKEPSSLCINYIEQLSLLEPFGRGNEQPVFCLCSVSLKSVVPIGSGKHVKLIVSAKGRDFECLFFSKTAGELGLFPGDIVDIAFWPQINDYRGNRNVQLLLCAVRPAADNAGAFSAALKKFESGIALSDAEAAAILPDRHDFVSIWRYLECAFKNGELVAERRELISALSGACRVPVAKCSVCLNVFGELGLINIRTRHGKLILSLPETQVKADLSSSVILKGLTR